MLLPGDNIAQTWLFFLILATWIFTFGDTIGDKTLNLKIGFDITRGSNGDPALRILDFADTDMNRRADVEGSIEIQTSPRADSLSDSDEKSKEIARSGEDKDDDNDDYSDNDNQRSTRGLKAGDFEPDDDPNLHGKYGAESDSD